MTRLIGLGHYSRTGKDSFANFYIEAIRQQNPSIKVLKQSLAWKLKQVTHELYGWAGLRGPEYYETPEGALAREVVLPELGMTPVGVWVAFGTKGVREQVYDRTWLDYLLKSDLGTDILVIPDVRFPNEAEAIKKLGGILIKVVRPGFGPRDTVADRVLVGYTGWTYVLGAAGTMGDLEKSARFFADFHALGMDTPTQSVAKRHKALSVEKL